MFDLAWPWMLLLIFVPLLLWLLTTKVPTLPAALKIPFFASLARVQNSSRGLYISKQGLVLALIWLFLVLALAGPRWVGSLQPQTREGYNLMMVLDLSGSMDINDMYYQGRPISRLAVVKEAAMQFVRERAGDRIGLILFGSRAYLQTPLTTDTNAVLERIIDATVGLAGNTTSLGDALGMAVKNLQNVPPKGRVIVLLTDGANTSGVLDPLKAADFAKTEEIKVYTIGLGGPANQGLVASSQPPDLDEASLKKIAASTGGQYFRATDSKSLQSIYQTINQLETVHYKEAPMRPQKDYYPWPLSLSLALFFYWAFSQTSWRRRYG